MLETAKVFEKGAHDWPKFAFREPIKFSSSTCVHPTRISKIRH